MKQRVTILDDLYEYDGANLYRAGSNNRIIPDKGGRYAIFNRDGVRNFVRGSFLQDLYEASVAEKAVAVKGADLSHGKFIIAHVDITTECATIPPIPTVFESEPEARQAAEHLAVKWPSYRFVVLRIQGSVVANKIAWDIGFAIV